MRCLLCDEEVAEGFMVYMCKRCDFAWEPERLDGKMRYPMDWRNKDGDVGCSPLGCLAVFGELEE